MIEQKIEPLLAQTVAEVLEAMFFTSPLGPPEGEADGTVLEACLRFRGRVSGTFSLNISEDAARSLAAGFLGEDNEALSTAQIGHVISELTNMLCGSLVSKLEQEEPFDLDPPELLDNGSAEQPRGLPAAQQSFALEDGALTLFLYLDGRA